jgi:hypothetical protein
MGPSLFSIVLILLVHFDLIARLLYIARLDAACLLFVLRGRGMASIKQYNGSWRATVKRKGHGVLVKQFPGTPAGKAEVELWAGEQEQSIRLAGLPVVHRHIAETYHQQR